MAEKAVTGITEQLISLGFESDRLKTGTPAKNRRKEPGLFQNGRAKRR
jgi:tRNA U34 5-carboxymethylaminomethyl modifying enzyme MnmG/GidA